VTSFGGADCKNIALNEDCPAFSVDDTIYQTAFRHSQVLVNETNDETAKHRPRSSLVTEADTKTKPSHHKTGYDAPSDAELLDFIAKSDIGELNEDPAQLCKEGQDELREFLEWAFNEET